MTSQPKHIVKSCAIQGADAVAVDVEASLADRWVAPELPSPAAGKETVIRVRSALQAAEVHAPGVRLEMRTTVPTGGGLDLAMAMAALLALGEVPVAALEGILVLGELGLDGSLRATRGVLSAALLARASGLRGVLIPASCAWEANMVERIEVLAADDLAGAIAVLRGERETIDLPVAEQAPTRSSHAPDMAEVRGQGDAIVKIANLVSRRRGMLLVGPPGTGKTMLARRVATLLPEMMPAECVEVTRVYTAVGLAVCPVTARPFRAPHHTISTAGLCGGVGPTRRPGELQLATRGVLFLDELTEFRLSTITSLGAALRQMPADERPLVVASANPCPCGWLDSVPARACACSPEAVSRHRAHARRLAAELGIEARMEDGPPSPQEDVVRVEAVLLADLSQATPSESSASIRERIWA